MMGTWFGCCNFLMFFSMFEGKFFTQFSLVLKQFFSFFPSILSCPSLSTSKLISALCRVPIYSFYSFKLFPSILLHPSLSVSISKSSPSPNLWFLYLKGLWAESVFRLANTYPRLSETPRWPS